ncbi:MAG: homoserine dehydrogenase [Vulcanibacillus sp.]
MKEENTINIGLLGLGTVGSGVIKIIEGHKQDIFQKTGVNIKVEKVLVQDIEKERDVNLDRNILTNDPYEVLDNPNIEVIIEVMGSVEETFQYLMYALEKGKHIVTANKDLIAIHGPKLMVQANNYKRNIFYEASVAGGIPILRSLVEGFSSDRITKIVGIVNGTTNYILSKMSEEGLSFDSMLEKAKNLGYAEADPTSDIEGLDATMKMVILSNLAFNMEVSFNDVYVKGITGVTEEDIKFGKQLGYVIKLLGTAKLNDEQLEVSVQPTLVRNNHPLAKIDGVNNAIYVYGEAVGETMFFGSGAGQLPTATAVVSDLISVIKHNKLGIYGENIMPYRTKRIKTDELIEHRYFIRLKVIDRIGVLAQITKLFAENMISLQEILQLSDDEDTKAQLILITHITSKDKMNNLLKDIGKLEVVNQINSVYPVEEGE